MSSPTLDATKPSTPPDDLTVSPETRKAVKRTKEEILVEDLAVDCVAAFSLYTHPSLGPSFGDIEAGPFDDSESAKDCVATRGLTSQRFNPSVPFACE